MLAFISLKSAGIEYGMSVTILKKYKVVAKIP
jgi:hypothetical protein